MSIISGNGAYVTRHIMYVKWRLTTWYTCCLPRYIIPIIHHCHIPAILSCSVNGRALTDEYHGLDITLIVSHCATVVSHRQSRLTLCVRLFIGGAHVNNFFMQCWSTERRMSSDVILSVPCVRRSTLGTCAFSVAGPTIWNSLPDHLRDSAVDSEQFRRDLKTYLFAGHSLAH